jgi:hypothetical protein
MKASIVEFSGNDIIISSPILGTFLIAFFAKAASVHPTCVLAQNLIASTASSSCHKYFPYINPLQDINAVATSAIKRAVSVGFASTLV